MSNKLAGKIAVITGGTSGIGLATVKEFLAEGARVVFTGRKKEEVGRLAAKLEATGLVSDQGTTGQSLCAVYSASKGALNSLVKVASTELSPRGIRINAVCPGPIATNLLAPSGIDDATAQSFASRTLNKIPLKRFGLPEEVARLVSFLSSDDAAYITGSEYVIDGGTDVNPIIG